MWKGDLLKAGIDSDGNVNKVNGLQLGHNTFTADGEITGRDSWIRLNNSSTALAITLDAPIAGQLLIITQVDSGTEGHTVTLTAGTYDGSNDVATFNAQDETLVLFGVSATRFVVLENIGSVSLS